LKEQVSQQDKLVDTSISVKMLGVSDNPDDNTVITFNGLGYDTKKPQDDVIVFFFLAAHSSGVVLRFQKNFVPTQIFFLRGHQHKIACSSYTTNPIDKNVSNNKE
jgi:hypothetical protein